MKRCEVDYFDYITTTTTIYQHPHMQAIACRVTTESRSDSHSEDSS
jgi:hypothetical protein